MKKVFQNRLFLKIKNRMGMELLQMVILIAIVIALGGTLLWALQSYFPDYVEGLMSKLTQGDFSGERFETSGGDEN